MNEELQKALGELLGKANSGIDTASNFLAAELPDVIQQLLAWYMVENVIFFIVSLLSSLALWKAAARCRKENEKNRYEMWDFGMCLCGFGSVITVFISISFLVDGLKIWIAPKLWLIEYAASLTK